MAQAIEYVDAILKTNVRIAELDTINNGSVGAALAATRAAEDTRVAELEARVAQLAGVCDESGEQEGRWRRIWRRRKWVRVAR